MKKSILLMSLAICICLVALLGTLVFSVQVNAQAVDVEPLAKTSDLDIRATAVTYLKNLDLLVFEQQVNGIVGRTLPKPAGQLDGAPVLGYVFPTTLKPEDVGFSPTEGIVALAVTSHPDFDDTPLWDESSDRNYANDGVIFHPHWVVLVEDKRVPGGLAVKQFQKDAGVVLPPTNPGMPIYIDSPGYAVMAQQNTLKVLVPAQRVNRKTNFKFDAVSAYMQVNISAQNRPMLGVYEVYSVLSKKLSLPYSVQKK